MSGRIQLHGRADENIVSDSNPVIVHEDAVVVHETVVSKLDIDPVVTKEGRFDPNSRPQGTKQTTQYLFFARNVIGSRAGKTS
jgi:hypothetical protein